LTLTRCLDCLRCGFGSNDRLPMRDRILMLSGSEL
jgi:hypothetical protein